MLYNLRLRLCHDNLTQPQSIKYTLLLLFKTIIIYVSMVHLINFNNTKLKFNTL